MNILIDDSCRRTWKREDRINPVVIPENCHVREIPDESIWTVHEYLHDSGQCFCEELVYAAHGKIHFAY